MGTNLKINPILKIRKEPYVGWNKGNKNFALIEVEVIDPEKRIENQLQNKPNEWTMNRHSFESTKEGMCRLLGIDVKEYSRILKAMKNIEE